MTKANHKTYALPDSTFANLAKIGTFAHETIVETLWSTRCVLCDMPDALICDPCRETLPFVDQWKACPRCGAPYGRIQCCECNDVMLLASGYSGVPLNACRSALMFGEEAGSIIRVWKDGGERRLVGFISQAMVSAVDPDWLKRSPTITSIPATKAALRRRGFDHGFELARAIAQQLNLPHIALLTRPKSSDQRSLGRRDRSKNMKGKFSVIPEIMIPEAVIIVDDVCTTGATLYAAAATLQKRGVKSVYGLTFARVS